jgi:molybdopterin-guanine dinucleotide biosynthesis protein B
LRKTSSIDNLIALFGDFDYLFVEGLRNLPLPRIAVFRNEIDGAYFDYAQAIAIDETIDLKSSIIREGIDVLNLNDPRRVLEWIERRAKEV